LQVYSRLISRRFLIKLPNERKNIMKNTFKKLAAILTVASTLLTCACAAKQDIETTEIPETTVAVETTEVSETTVAVEITNAMDDDKITADYKTEYLSVIEDYEERYGVYTEITNEYDTKGYKGVYFCELFDWNTDGTPELMIGYAKDFAIWFNIEYISVYGFENGKAVQLLNEKYNHMHLSLDGSQDLTFAKGDDGLVRLVLANEEAEEWNTSGVDYVSYNEGKIERTSINAYGFSEKETDNEDYFERYTVNGKKVSFAEYEAKEKELGEEFGVAFIENISYDNLISFLSGETESYTNEFFSSQDYEDEKHADWVYETAFGYKMTF
jgi:co-chaperonin GroES (HSP10)